MKKPPETIYLQWNEPFIDDQFETVTWCVDKINDDDIEYVRKTSPNATIQQAEGEIRNLYEELGSVGRAHDKLLVENKLLTDTNTILQQTIDSLTKQLAATIELNKPTYPKEEQP